MQYNAILIRYNEIGLKSNSTRKLFVKKLIMNIKLAISTKEITAYEIKDEFGRIFIFSTEIEKIAAILPYVFGIISFSLVHSASWTTYDEILEIVANYAKTLLKPQMRFAVRARRANVEGFTSIALARDAGSAIWRAIPDLKVDLTNPEIEVTVEVRDHMLYTFATKIPGPGGLPLGTTGFKKESNVLCLFSAGIDSPVATWMIIRRGPMPILVNFVNQSLSTHDDTDLVFKTAQQLAHWTPGYALTLIQVPHEAPLRVFMKHARKDTCLLCKRQMLRVATVLAEKYHALALVTGDNLAQVASQTLANLQVLSQATPLPILRPVIGMDKNEIIDLALKIGTLGEERKNAGGCAAVPTNPQLRGDLEWLRDFEDKYIPITELVQNALKNSTVWKISANEIIKVEAPNI